MTPGYSLKSASYFQKHVLLIVETELKVVENGRKGVRPTGSPQIEASQRTFNLPQIEASEKTLTCP